MSEIAFTVLLFKGFYIVWHLAQFSTDLKANSHLRVYDIYNFKNSISF